MLAHAHTHTPIRTTSCSYPCHVQRIRNVPAHAHTPIHTTSCNYPFHVQRIKKCATTRKHTNTHYKLQLSISSPTHQKCDSTRTSHYTLQSSISFPTHQQCDSTRKQSNTHLRAAIIHFISNASKMGYHVQTHEYTLRAAVIHFISNASEMC